MPFRVRLAEGAVRDLERILGYLDRHAGSGHADRLLDRLEAAFESLAEFPLRGRCPMELADLGILDYREVAVKPYPLIYQVSGDSVVVLVIADGRRDMRTLLQRRLLQA